MLGGTSTLSVGHESADTLDQTLEIRGGAALMQEAVMSLNAIDEI